MLFQPSFLVFVFCWCWSDGTFDCDPKTDWKSVHMQIRNWYPYQMQVRTDEFLYRRYYLQERSFAGRTEFPWLVELRTIANTENWYRTGEWANGNLVSGRYVLTTCEAVAVFEVAPEKSFSFDKDYGDKSWLLKKKLPRKYKILYSSDYPYKERTLRVDEVGTRRVSAFLPHPKCNYYSLDYSLGVVEIQGKAIFPDPPYTSYLHLDWNCTAFQEIKMAYNYQGVQPTPENRDDRYEEEPNTCLIAVWGRFIRGDEKFRKTEDQWGHSEKLPQTMNYKLKYKVRFVDPQICSSNVQAFPQRYWLQKAQYMECMGLDKEERIGTICNHDRGAPIICDGAVHAIMLAGATELNCNNSNPMPFLVIDAHFAVPMYAQINSFIFHNLTDSEERDKKAHFSGAHAQFTLDKTGVVLFAFLVILASS